MSVIVLKPGEVSLLELERLYKEQLPARLTPDAQPAVEEAARRIQEAAQGELPVYGVNTGFGKLASVKIGADDTELLQRNLILSHCCGVGELAETAVVRLMMILKLISLGRGASGVRWHLIELIEKMLEHDVIPCVPAQGSVGASGDLAPLAHMAAVMIGEGEAYYKGDMMPGGKALGLAGLKPVVLGAKEGLALINGTQYSTAYALAGLFSAWCNAQS